MINIATCYEAGDFLNGKRVVVIFKKSIKPKKFRVIHGSSADKASVTTFNGDEDCPVICTIESSYHKSKKKRN